MACVLSTWRVRAVSSSERLFGRPLLSQKGSIPLWASVRDPPFRDLGEQGEHESVSPWLHRPGRPHPHSVSSEPSITVV